MPRGTIIVGFIDRDSYLGQQYSLRKERSRFYKNATFYSTEEVADCLKRTGFRTFRFTQAVFCKEAPEEEHKKNSFRKGGFVAVRAEK
jgi:hypothetical protein